jgi:hypothetical protein
MACHEPTPAGSRPEQLHARISRGNALVGFGGRHKLTLARGALEDPGQQLMGFRKIVGKSTSNFHRLLL